MEITIPEQLTEIYFNHENWHESKMEYDEAYRYHSNRYHNGSIHVYEEDGEVLGYYERYFIYSTCFLHNVWVKDGHRHSKVFKTLYRHFFDTMPENITRIVGEKQKIGGKVVERIIRRSRYGK